MKRREAQRLGLATYLTGKPCRNGHEVERSTKTGHCHECERARYLSDARKAERRQSYSENLEVERARGREQARKYRAANLERCREAQNSRRRAQRAAGIAARKAATAARREAKAQAKAARQVRSAELRAAAVIRGRERSKAWRMANPERFRELLREWGRTPEGRENKRGRKIRKRGALISELSSLQRGRCAYCREKLMPATTHVDHIQPRAKGGPNARRNYQLACAACNGAKSAKDPIVFAQEIGMLL